MSTPGRAPQRQQEVGVDIKELEGETRRECVPGSPASGQDCQAQNFPLKRHFSSLLGLRFILTGCGFSTSCADRHQL